MMKFKNYMMGIATVSLLATMASCQNNDEVNPTPEVQAPTAEEMGKGFMAFSLSMPNNGVTRANDQFDDGEPNEYTVEDVILVLFAGNDGESEDQAKLVSAYNLSNQREKINFLQHSSADQITSATNSNHLIAEIKTADLAGKKPYAFIILNDHQYVEVDEINHTLKTGGEGKLWDIAAQADKVGVDLKGTTFGDFRKLALKESGRNFAAQSFFMCNAPVATQAASESSTGEVHTLVPFSSDKIYRIEAQAIANPACCVNVERALAKVDCTFALGVDPKIESTSIPIELLKWDLDNTNDVCYLARSMKPTSEVTYMTWSSDKLTAPNYRFTSNSVINTDQWNAGGDVNHTHQNVYRTYWAEDPNYDADVETFTGVPMTTRAGKVTDEVNGNKLALATERASGAAYYTTENTFDVTHQTVKNTTRLVVAAKINGGKPFYTLMENSKVLYEDDKTTTAYTTPGTIQNYISDALANRVSVQEWAKTYIDGGTLSDGWSNNLFVVEFVDKVTAAELNTTGADVQAPAGRKIAKISLNPLYTGFGTNFAAAQTAFEGIKPVQQAYLYGSYPLHYYPGGIAYYQVLVQHFGQHETPWEANASMVNITVGQNSIYGSTVQEASRDFLGRYGIVRNNWYSLTIKGVSAIGSSTVPPLTDEPDDAVHNYMTVHVNILPWVKRTQDNIVL